MYGAGRGVQRDYVEGFKWLTLAYAGATNAKERGSAGAGQLAFRAEMSAASIAEAEQRAREWAEAFKTRQQPQ